MPGDHQPAQTGRTEETAYPRSSQRNVQTVIVKRIPVETGDEQVSLDAMKQALEALERGETKLRYEAITALCAAIEQAQEPVAWMNPSWIDPDTRGWASDSFESIQIEGWIPVYTAPRRWQGLTADEIWDEWCKQTKPERDTRNFVAAFALAIEAKLREKNT